MLGHIKTVFVNFLEYLIGNSMKQVGGSDFLLVDSNLHFHMIV